VSISLRSVSLLRGYGYGGQGSSVSKLGIRGKSDARLRYEQTDW